MIFENTEDARHRHWRYLSNFGGPKNCDETKQARS
jgi:hypothetical protein